MKDDLTNSEFSEVCEVINARMGLHFPIERWAILGRNLALSAKDFGFENMDGFVPWLLSSELTKDQINTLATHLTISETYFWREPQVFSALTNHILPELIISGKKGNKKINIISAGCSTGEEPYSLAIALHKTIPDIKNWNISIEAFDINPNVVEKAKAGIYGPWSFRNTPEWIITRYFHRLEDRKYEIIPDIKKMVNFSCKSLTEDESYFEFRNKTDIIFCRNVLMYFSEEWVKRISENLFHSLKDDGWFIVSSSELSSQVFPQYTTVNFPGAVLYSKTKNGHAHKLPEYVPIEEKFQPSSAESLAKAGLHPSQTVEKFKSLKVEIDQPDSSPLQQPQPNPEDISATTILAIRLLANQGYLTEALILCNEAILNEKLITGYYFIRASILQEMEKSTEAIASLKQAIYIDPDYVMGHFTLGNLFNQSGNSKSAKRYFKNVLDLLKSYKNDYILPESEGLSVKYIREIIYANMEKYVQNEK